VSEELWCCKTADAVVIYNAKEKTAEMVEAWKEDERFNFNENGELVLTSKIAHTQSWIRYGIKKDKFLSMFKDNYFYVGRV